MDQMNFVQYGLQKNTYKMLKVRRFFLILNNIKVLCDIFTGKYKMMKYKYLLLFALVIGGMLSCIKDEPLFREADIESFVIEDDGYVSTTITNTNIQIVVKDGTDYTNLIPVVKLSPGATISPAADVATDFSKEVTYTVVSEDGKYQKEYTVEVGPPVSLKFNFEQWVEEGTAHKYPALRDRSWSSANPGIMLAKVGQVEKYPTRSTTDAVGGKYAALLQTQAGGTFWGNLIPIFSGSLFKGKFEINMAEFVKSTKFGQIHPKELGKPVKFTGYFKYTPGEKFINKEGKEVPGRKDKCAIYSVLYRVAKGEAGKDEYLDGTTIETSEKIVAEARLENELQITEFKEFSLVYKYYEEIDYDRYDYKLAVVFASSKDGASYEGAPGSTLVIDESEVICEPFDQN